MPAPRTCPGGRRTSRPGSTKTRVRSPIASGSKTASIQKRRNCASQTRRGLIDFSRSAPFHPSWRRSPESARAWPGSFQKGQIMRKTITALLVALAGSLLAISPAYAQATRTWVLGVGDDANPCARTAPCKTFAGAISKTAANGEINVLDPGGYGAVTITKAISIIADGDLAGVLVSGTNGIIVNAGATDAVLLRGLDINGVGAASPSGVQITNAKTVTIERSLIMGFTTEINVAP